MISSIPSLVLAFGVAALLVALYIALRANRATASSTANDRLVPWHGWGESIVALICASSALWFFAGTTAAYACVAAGAAAIVILRVSGVRAQVSSELMPHEAGLNAHDVIASVRAQRVLTLLALCISAAILYCFLQQEELHSSEVSSLVVIATAGAAVGFIVPLSLLSSNNRGVRGFLSSGSAVGIMFTFLATVAASTTSVVIPDFRETATLVPLLLFAILAATAALIAITNGKRGNEPTQRLYFRTLLMGAVIFTQSSLILLTRFEPNLHRNDGTIFMPDGPIVALALGVTFTILWGVAARVLGRWSVAEGSSPRLPRSNALLGALLTALTIGLYSVALQVGAAYTLSLAAIGSVAVVAVSSVVLSGLGIAHSPRSNDVIVDVSIEAASTLQSLNASALHLVHQRMAHAMNAIVAIALLVSFVTYSGEATIALLSNSALPLVVTGAFAVLLFRSSPVSIPLAAVCVLLFSIAAPLVALALGGSSAVVALLTGAAVGCVVNAISTSGRMHELVAKRSEQLLNIAAIMAAVSFAALSK